MIALKNCRWERSGEVLTLMADQSRTIELDDPTGDVAALLAALREGAEDAAALTARLRASGHDTDVATVRTAIEALDGLRVLERSETSIDRRPRKHRDYSNLAYFDLFSSLDVTAEDFRSRLADAHVVQLGVGGLGSNVLQSLCGLGVGRLTLLDNDLVEPANFARQFVYREDQVGTPKVERAAQWARAFSSDIDVRTVSRWVGGPDDVSDLLTDADLVVSGVDQPNDIDLWVNEACVTAGVPWIRGGMFGTMVIYFSVDPGRTACYRCSRAASDRGVVRRLSSGLDRVNRGIGPAAALVGSLVAFEALRYLTGFAPPYAAGASVILDTADGCRQTRTEWARDPGCPACARTPRAMAGAS
ncbi:HesA/MoeB/ThiF family protein [Promicromonospora sp. NPDC052451]|uniref:HesA/MoeB/ThiF family protein n=1 Tax=unclassified Promicromonospora TaxID=2647929 RepID=UPI0037C53275